MAAAGDTTVRLRDAMPARERYQQARHAQALQAAAEPLVRGLLAQLGKPHPRPAPSLG